MLGNIILRLNISFFLGAQVWSIASVSKVQITLEGQSCTFQSCTFQKSEGTNAMGIQLFILSSAYLSSKLYIIVWTLLKYNFLSLASFILLFQELTEISSFPALFVFSH